MFDRVRRYIQHRNAGAEARRAAATNAARTTANPVERGPFAIGQLTVAMRPVGPDGTVGEWKTVEDGKNLVVTQAEGLMALMSVNAANSAFNYIELGDPSPATPPTLDDTTLQQTTGQRKAVSSTVLGRTVTLEATFLTGEANGFTYTEAGLFTGPFAGGTMFARKAFAGITKTSSFELRFTWLITFLVQTSGGECAGIGLVGPSAVASYTVYNAVGAEASIAATFDFAVGANRVEVFLAGQRLIPGVHYNEAGPPLNAPIGGPAGNKGINLIAFTANPGDQFFLYHLNLVT